MVDKTDNHKTLLERFEAMEGEVLRMEPKMRKVRESIESNNLVQKIDEIITLLDESKRCLGIAHRLSLHRRNKRLINSFQTLPVLPKRISELNSKTAAFQVYCTKIIKTIDRLYKKLTELKGANLKKLGSKVDEFSKILSSIYSEKKVKQTELMFTLAKQVVDYLKETPHLDNCYQDFFAGTGEFKDSDRKKMAGIWSDWIIRMANETGHNKIVFSGTSFNKSLANFHLRDIDFKKGCRFEKGCEKLNTSFNVFFENSEFRDILFREDGSSSSKNSTIFNGKFMRVRGTLNFENSLLAGAEFIQCKRLGLFFGESDVQNIKLTGGDFDHLGFRNCTKVRNIKIEATKMMRIDIAGTKIYGFEVEGVSINSSDFNQAEITRGNFINWTIGMHGEDSSFSNAVFTNCTIKQGGSFWGMSKEIQKMVNCDFSGAKFINTSFEQIVFLGCRFNEARFSECNKKRRITAKLISCSLKKSRFRNCLFGHAHKLDRYSLELKDIRPGGFPVRTMTYQTDWHSIDSATQDLVDIYGKQSQSVQDLKTKKVEIEKRSVHLEGTAVFRNCVLDNIEMEDCESSTPFFAGEISLVGSSLTNVTITGEEQDQEDLVTKVNLDEANFISVDFLGPMIKSMTIKNSNFSSLNLNLQSRSPNLIRFEQCRFTTVDFGKSCMSNVYFKYECSFSSCKFSETIGLDISARLSYNFPQKALADWKKANKIAA